MQVSLLFAQAPQAHQEFVTRTTIYFTFLISLTLIFAEAQPSAHQTWNLTQAQTRNVFPCLWGKLAKKSGHNVSIGSKSKKLSTIWFGSGLKC